MALLYPYLGSIGVGVKAVVKARKVLWLKVGEGSYSRRDPYAARFSAQTTGWLGAGHFSVEIEILAPNEDAEQGPVRLAVNDEPPLTGTYRVEGSSLVLEGTHLDKTRRITLTPEDGGVVIAGDVPASIKILPA